MNISSNEARKKKQIDPYMHINKSKVLVMIFYSRINGKALPPQSPPLHPPTMNGPLLTVSNNQID